MLLAHRKRHFQIFSVLAIVLPLCLIAMLVFNPTYEPVSQSTAPLFTAAGFDLPADQSEFQLIQSVQVTAQGMNFSLGKIQDSEGQARLLFTTRSLIKQPDLLVYWQPDASTNEEGEVVLAEGAILLGTLSGNSSRQLDWPAAIRTAAGHLAIYSNGTQKVIVTFPFPPELLVASVI